MKARGRTGWSGSTFWPDASRDIHGYVFGPQGGAGGFASFAFDDVFAGIFWPSGYPSDNTTGQAGGPDGDRRVGEHPRLAALSPELARICSNEASGLPSWSFERIEQAVKPTDAQRSLFEELRAALNKAQDAVKSSCPDETPVTTTDRMDAMESRLAAILRALEIMRPALSQFYDSLSEEQKARLDRIDIQTSTGRQGKAVARSLGLGERGGRMRCGESMSGYHDRTFQHIERLVRPSDTQRPIFDELKAASSVVAKTLQASCETETPRTLPGRLDAIGRRLEAMHQAVQTLAPSLAKFYDALDRGQKRRFNTMSGRSG